MPAKVESKWKTLPPPPSPPSTGPQALREKAHGTGGKAENLSADVKKYLKQKDATGP